MKDQFSSRVHIKVLQGDSHNVITRMANKYIDTLYELDPHTEIISVDTSITPGNWINATIRFKTSTFDGSGLYDAATLEKMIHASKEPVAVL